MMNSNLYEDIKEFQISTYNTDKVIESSIKHKSPAFLGEVYPLVLNITQMKNYKVKSLLITLCEILEEEKHLTKRIPGNRKASLISCGSEDSDDWTYILYVGESMEKLKNHHYVINEPKESEDIKFGLQFREEGKKKFEVMFMCTISKAFNDKGEESEFTIESKDFFTLEVLCPFNLITEWIIPEPSIEQLNKSKTYLGVNEKSTLGVKIVTGSYPQANIYNIAFKIRHEDILKLIEDYTNTESQWKEWPVTLGKGECLSLSYSILALMPFNDQQIADIEILWSRVDNDKKISCLIPLPAVSANKQGINVKLSSVPAKMIKSKECFVTYEINNATEEIANVEYKVEENDHFFVAGDVEGKLILSSYEAEEVSIGLIPLYSGKFDLPSVVIAIASKEGTNHILIDSNFKYPVYVFPS